MQSPWRWGDDMRHFPKEFHPALRRLADHLRKNPDIKVWIILDVPWEDRLYDPRHHLSRVSSAGIPERLKVRYPRNTMWKQGNDEVRRMLDGLVTFVDPEPFLCQDDLCDITGYLDDNHLHRLFAEEHAVWIDPIFEAVAAEMKAD